MRWKYISKSSKTNKEFSSLCAWKLPKPSLLYSGVSASAEACESRQPQKDPTRLHPPRAEPERFIGAFSAPNELTFPSPAQLAAVAACVTKGKCALFQATLLEDENWRFHRHSHIGTFYLDS
jgi:hypothetical protein